MKTNPYGTQKMTTSAIARIKQKWANYFERLYLSYVMDEESFNYLQQWMYENDNIKPTKKH